MSSPTREAFLAASATAPLEAEAQERAWQGDTEDPAAHSTIVKIEHDTSKDEIPPPRITRSIPPPPVNFRSNPTPPSLSPPPKSPLQALRADEEEHPASQDIPPRPIPPPGWSGSVTEHAPSPPPRQINCMPVTPPIVTTFAVPEQVASEEHEIVEHAAEEETSESRTPQPEYQEDEASARRRAIAERMACLGSIRFGAPRPMNPLSRPPLPPAPPPTSIPPDETESEGKDEEGQGAQEQDEEVARKQRIAAQLVGMGGMRFGMLPPASARREDSESEDAIPPIPVPAPPQRHPPTRKPPPPAEVPVKWQSEQAGRKSREMSDDGVQVEAEETEMEEVHYSNVGRRPSAATGSSSRQTSLDESSPGETPTILGRSSENAVRPQSEYIMVKAEEPDGDDAPALPRRLKSTCIPARSIPLPPPPPPPSAIDPPETLTSQAQWELPSILQGVECGEGSDDSTAVHVPPPVLSSHPGSRGHLEVGLPSSTTTVSRGGSGTGSGSDSGRRNIGQQNRYHCCGWATSQGQICNQHIQGHDFSEHLRANHDIVGPDKAPLRCRWINCFAEMKKESLTRHVQEKHLELRFSCPSCSEQFTRNYTMQNHVLRKHS